MPSTSEAQRRKMAVLYKQGKIARQAGRSTRSSEEAEEAQVVARKYTEDTRDAEGVRVAK